MIAASSATPSAPGPHRQARTAAPLVWTDAWDRGPDSPGALPMPLQSIISRDAFNSIDRAAGIRQYPGRATSSATSSGKASA